MKLFSSILLTATVIISGCKKESTDDIKQEETAQTFIPAKNKKFLYKIQSDGSDAGTATQWITSENDSAGIKIYNLHTDIQSGGNIMPLDNRVFTLNGKTYNEIKLPEAWATTINLLNSMPNTTVTKAETFGFPAFIAMENAIKDGSILLVAGNTTQGQHVDYVSNGNAAAMEQLLSTSSGTAIVETMEVPAGSFVCNRFTYSNNSNTTITTKGGTYTGDGVENVTLWVAHGIGIVKQESSSELTVLVPLPTGGVKKIISNTHAVTTLEKVE